MQDCIFCKIVAGTIPCAKVHEDDDVLAFLDVNPLTKGHCLVIPKSHAQDVFDISEDNLEKVVVIAKHICEKMKKNLQADGIRLSQSSGKVAHQEIMHFHLHIIPRYADDGLLMNDHGRVDTKNVDMEELKKLAEKINS